MPKPFDFKCENCHLGIDEIQCVNCFLCLCQICFQAHACVKKGILAIPAELMEMDMSQVIGV